MKKVILIVILMMTQILIKSQTTRTTVNPGLWSNPLTWDTGVPNTGDNVVINHSISINVKDTVNDITVNQTSFCSDTLFITGLLNLETDIFSSPIVLVNNDTFKGRLGQTSNGQIIGDYIWQKWIERCDGWGQYGGPFDVPLSDYGFFHTGFPGTAGPTFWCNTYFYDELIPNQPADTGWYKPSNVNNVLPKEVGVFIFDSSSSATNNSRVIELKGSTDLSTTVTYTISCTGGNNKPENGWNLLSNPYPGTIDWDTTGWVKSKISNAIWVWDNCNDVYSAYVDGIGTNGGIPYVSSGQAFWIKAEKGGPTLTSTRDVITNINQEIKSNGNSYGILRIKLDNDEVVISLNDSATNHYDTLYDAYKYHTIGSRLYTKIDTIHYSINSVNSIDTIPLYVRGDGMLEFNSDISDICYEDLLNGNVNDVITNPQYVFSSVDDEYYHRFNIIITPSTQSSIDVFVGRGKYPVKTVNLLGQVVNKDTKGFVIQFYNDGTYLKIFNK